MESFHVPVPRVQAHRKVIVGVAVSPDGTMMATASLDHTAKLSSLDGGAWRAKVLRGHDDLGPTVALAPKDPIMFIRSTDNAVQCWSTATRTALFTLRANDNTVVHIDTHPTEHAIVASSGDGRVGVWKYSHRQSLA
jgi:WD40 repeat protein